MANIVPNTDEKVFPIKKWLGLNESPDGDTQLKMGEAAIQRNWRVTKENHLKVRPGYRSLRQFRGPVRGLWTGYVAGEQKVVCCADGAIWDVLENRRIGDIEDRPVTMFGFDNKVYFLDGVEYMVWDGDGFADTVEGYIPLVVSAAKPEGGGTTIEPVNRLTGRRRCKFSADGTATVYHLPEPDDVVYVSVDKVEIGGKEPEIAWTADLAAGTVTFTEAPPEGQNSVQIWYTLPNDRRPEVEAMRFAEQFNGASDTRVFLYGDGTAKALYSGVKEDGNGSAEYFPDLYEVRIGSDNAPLTAMSKNFNRLMSYKADGGAYSTTYTVKTLGTSVVPGFETVSVHKEIGNEAPGQVRLVNNVPRTFYGGNLYDWVYANYFSRDERNTKLVSEKVERTLHGADPLKVYAFDDDRNQEYYLFLNDEAGTVVINNYGNDTWYTYDNLRCNCAVRVGESIYLGLENGKLAEMNQNYTSDDGEVIRAYFATGNMSFDRDYKRKHSSTIWVSIKPTAFSDLLVTARSDRRTDYVDKLISKSLFSFRHPDFRHWTFNTNNAPQMVRLKMKVKKFVYYKLILKSEDRSSDTTVLGVDFRVRFTGFVK